MRAGIAIADSSAGNYAAIGILIALAEREKSGRGQWVQTSLLQAQIAMMDFQAARYLIDGEVPGPAGNDHPFSTPMGVMETADGHINIGVGGDRQWRDLCTVMAWPDLASHPDYATQADRLRNRPALTRQLAEIFKTRASADWLQALEAAGVPAGPIHQVDEMFADPQVRHLGIAVPGHHRTRGDIRVVGQPLAMSRTPPGVEAMIPQRGEHTEEILTEAGYGAADIARLRNAKVV
jgi:crotonobetainyl-CoA:carnitine CoA-transferase CaiB-like acyl-CoA transferase